MGLYDRLSKSGTGTDAETDDTTAARSEAEATPKQASATSSDGAAPAPAVHGQVADDRNADLRRRLHQRVLTQISANVPEKEPTPEQLEQQVIEELNAAIAAEGVPLSAADRKDVVKRTLDDVLRFGPIQPLLDDPDITEVMVNAPDKVFVEVGGRLLQSSVKFLDADHVRLTIDRIVSAVGRRIDESSPYVDARLADGSRVNAVLPPIAVDSPTLTIRKFAREAYDASSLQTMGTLTPAASQFLNAVVTTRSNVLVSGGTGAGKTTTLNVLSAFIPSTERIVTIEDAAELQLQQPHVVRMEARPQNTEGGGEVSIRDLVRNSLRMRPDRIVVGEVRGGEAIDMLQAMNTGHDGSISTVHANSPRDVLARLETMVLMSGLDLPLRAVREQVASAVDLIVHQSRLADGSRRITHITEVTGMEGDTIQLQDIFRFDMSAGRDPDGHFLGTLKPTGIRPMLIDRIRNAGIQIPASMFDPDAPQVEVPA